MLFYSRGVMIKISVVVPVYNGEKYLQECLDSILNQTLEEIEIICIDDASTDQTSSILQQYKSQQSRIKIITNPINSGPVVSRNKGLDKATGKYVIFLDADDIFEKDMLNQVFQRMEHDSADICTFGEDEFTESIHECKPYPYPYMWWKKLEEKGAFSPKDIKDVLFNIWNGWPWDKMFRREFLLEKGIRFQEIPSSEDGLFVHGALAVAERLTCLNQSFVHHRMNLFSSLSNSRDHSWECCYLYLRALKKYLVEQNQFDTFKQSFINWVPNFLYWNYWTLKEQNRNHLYDAIKQVLLEEFDLLQYPSDYFYNGFYYWFIHEIAESENYLCCNIPIDLTGRWMKMLEQNDKKLAHLFDYIKEHQYGIGIWGAGERGKAFLSRYGHREEVKKVFDQNDKIEGCKIGKNHVIDLFNKETCKDIDFIIVTNTLYFQEIGNTAKSIAPEIKLFNLEAYQEPYLSFPLSIEECMI